MIIRYVVYEYFSVNKKKKEQTARTNTVTCQVVMHIDVYIYTIISLLYEIH